MSAHRDDAKGLEEARAISRALQVFSESVDRHRDRCDAYLLIQPLFDFGTYLAGNLRIVGDALAERFEQERRVPEHLFHSVAYCSHVISITICNIFARNTIKFCPTTLGAYCAERDIEGRPIWSSELG